MTDEKELALSVDKLLAGLAFLNARIPAETPGFAVQVPARAYSVSPERAQGEGDPLTQYRLTLQVVPVIDRDEPEQAVAYAIEASLGFTGASSGVTSGIGLFLPELLDTIPGLDTPRA